MFLAMILNILGTIGILGNFISVLILNKREMKSTANFLLKGRHTCNWVGGHDKGTDNFG